MRLSISSDDRFVATPDGAVWTSGPCHYLHWTRYLSVFDRVNVVARVLHVQKAVDNLQRADGINVSFSALPHFLGPLQYLVRSRQVVRAACAAIASEDALILNAPGQIASCLQPVVRSGHPFGLQVLGDPYDVFAPGVIRHPLRPLLRWWCTRRLRRQACRATAALYVTQAKLQANYPCPARMFGISDVDLRPEAFRQPPAIATDLPDSIRIVSVGSMAQLYKGFDVLIDAVALLRNQGLEIDLVLVGDGKFRGLLEQQVDRKGLGDRVHFRGQLPAGPRVREELDAANLFVLPSRTEGLPRALIEAMARSLPCLASRVGGIPELLDEEDLVPAGDTLKLAEAIGHVAGQPQRRQKMAKHNFARANEYQADALQSRREEFFRFVAESTADWHAACGSRRRSHLASPTPESALGADGRALAGMQRAACGVTSPCWRRKLAMKRAFDITASLLGLVLLAPLLATIALVLRFTLRGPILFRQRRPGLHEKPFTLYKFRTMREALDSQGRLIPDEQRTTRFGRFLRRTSLDELPELWNVLRGEMSLVGPRPLLMAFLEHYTPEQRRRHAVRPGITGWAQVNGRNNLTWEEKLAYDLWYVDQASLPLDLKILWLTIWVVLSRKGIAYSENCLPPALSNMSAGEILMREGKQT